MVQYRSRPGRVACMMLAVVIGLMLHKAAAASTQRKTSGLHGFGVVGILSVPANRALRDAQRTTWLTDPDNHIIHRFLFDAPTPDTLEEQAQHKDVYFLNSKYRGKANRFGEKLYLWLKYAHSAFPRAAYYGKVDDDTYVCGGAAFDMLRRTASSTMYLGCFTDGFNRNASSINGTHAEHAWTLEAMDSDSRRRVSHRYRADEMFVFLGPALVKRIVARRYCHSLDIGDCDDKRDLYDTNFAGQSLGLWLAPYTDLDLHPINDKALHYAGKPKMRVAYATLDVETYDVCFSFLVYHKATASQMGAIFKRHVDGHLPAREKPGLNENNVESIPPDLSNLTGKNSWVNALLGHH